MHGQQTHKPGKREMKDGSWFAHKKPQVQKKEGKSLGKGSDTAKSGTNREKPQRTSAIMGEPVRKRKRSHCKGFGVLICFDLAFSFSIT